MKILFVCEGNMMRSQMAEAFYKSLNEAADVLSAGATAETKDHISRRAIEAMDEIGIDTRTQRPVQLTPEMVDAADRVILFPTNFMPDYATNSPKAERWEVVDPHYHQDEGMELVRRVRDDIARRVTEFVGASDD